eukprot:CAMPEP_0118930876 /NCGR_PEP_ID=MMETSP1169-20130426/7419_1 /TAXON_ID=36882 /ORGANISM="Pyramimonas obovata, Strain CCMP722" /LENGTH=39 /DNA_ID= /DNA_START= /DNA_END= /DNA_ORIENTATION=
MAASCRLFGPAPGGIDVSVNGAVTAAPGSAAAAAAAAAA